MNFKNKKILVGVTGGIAAYKTCSLVNGLIAEGAEVKVVMTDAAKMFVTPITFQALTNNPVYDDLWKPVSQDTVEHIELSHWADLIIISPITANTIGKIACGIADNLLTTIVMASFPQTKVVIAPAMNTYMWENPYVQENLKKLSDTKKYHIVEPRSGVLACRDEGKGKIADNQDIIAAAQSLI
ncbi:MAG: bifunctional phosphopantothenoylcysteine decarboxylase/phosphopantothenate--cysteine ligase CoaBC [Candidatus Pacebacteria bacterium]|nr:bifunctional phosphopantothenoylcysteine decarboxylase/phosphopantothenate--cysteine ligase CoaBC [Candidatus Paceibacterota bacterium]